MSAFQIIILVFIAVVLFKATRRFLKKEISFWLFSFWAIIWVMIALVDIFPVIIERAAFYLGIGRGVDLVIYTSIIVIFYLLFRVFVRINKIERDISEMIRKIAINKMRKDD